jgi:hypothetical protein
MKPKFLHIPLFLLASSCFSAAPFVGQYTCKGSDPYLNRHYSGTVSISQQNTVYSLKMDYDTGEHSIGTGGQWDENLMSVVFQNQKNRKNIGLEQYHFSPDHSRIEGFWVYLGKDKLGKEVCTKLGPENQNKPIIS